MFVRVLELLLVFPLGSTLSLMEVTGVGVVLLEVLQEDDPVSLSSLRSFVSTVVTAVVVAVMLLVAAVTVSGQVSEGMEGSVLVGAASA